MWILGKESFWSVFFFLKSRRWWHVSVRSPPPFCWDWESGISRLHLIACIWTQSHSRHHYDLELWNLGSLHRSELIQGTFRGFGAHSGVPYVPLQGGCGCCGRVGVMTLCPVTPPQSEQRIGWASVQVMRGPQKQQGCWFAPPANTCHVHLKTHGHHGARLDVTDLTPQTASMQSL